MIAGLYPVRIELNRYVHGLATISLYLSLTYIEERHILTLDLEIMYVAALVYHSKIARRRSIGLQDDIPCWLLSGDVKRGPNQNGKEDQEKTTGSFHVGPPRRRSIEFLHHITVCQVDFCECIRDMASINIPRKNHVYPIR